MNMYDLRDHQGLEPLARLRPPHSENKLAEVRPGSTFDSYLPQDSGQATAKASLLKLAESLAQKAPQILREAHPFDRARLFVVTGLPGRGKSHLLEALVNHCLDHEPKLASALYLFRGNFAAKNCSVLMNFDHCPVILVDDLFHEVSAPAELHPRTHIDALMKFVHMLYEERRLAIMTCNFSIGEEVLAEVRKVDKIGRVCSRFQELLGNSREIQITGPDYRQILARTAVDPFEL